MRKSRIFFLLAAMLLAVASMEAQGLKKATPAQAKEMIAKINSTAAGIRTIRCNFVQVKKMSFLNDKMTSRGTMNYTNAGKLRWEYTSPYSYVFVINNHRVTMRNGSRTNSVDLRSSRLFQSIARVMEGSVTGKSLSSGKDFTAQMYTQGATWVAVLTPKDSAMKKMFKTVRLFFNPAHSMVSKVEMVESNGDTTTITLSGAKVNEKINDSVFNIN